MRRMTILSTLAAVALMGCDNPVDVPVDLPDGVSLSTNTPTGEPQGAVSAVFPSTNELNLANGWAHVLFVDVGVETVKLDFVSTRTFSSCFEYRIDDEAPTGNANFNGLITDGLWAYTCVNNSTTQLNISASDHVDIRSGFGAESDERFDWTRFYVLSLENKDQCKSGEWEALGFANQGQCVRYVETGKDSRTGG